MLHQIRAQQFYTDLDLYQQCCVLQKLVEFKDFSRPLSDFPVLFKADLIFNDFSSNPYKFKYFSSPWEPCKPILHNVFCISTCKNTCCFCLDFSSSVAKFRHNLWKSDPSPHTGSTSDWHQNPFFCLLSGVWHRNTLSSHLIKSCSIHLKQSMVD